MITFKNIHVNDWTTKISFISCSLKISAVFTEKKVSQVALRWLLQTAPVTSVIIGTTKVHQLEDNCGAVGWRLTEEEVGHFS